jgi:HSP20 family protein
MRWDPFGEFTSLRQAMDRLFEDSFVSTPQARGSGAGAVPLDVMETDEAVVVKASLPGVKSDDVEVSVHHNTLAITGEVRGEEETGEQGRFHHRERWYGRFSRQVTLPADVDTNACEARFEDGVLTVRLPKKEEARPRRISIGGGARPAIEGESHAGGQPDGTSGAEQGRRPRSTTG